MQVYPVAVPAEKIVRWAKEDVKSGPINYFCRAWKDYLIEEEFDHTKYDVERPEEYDLVSVTAGLDIEPRVERNYWILEVRVRHVIGLHHPSDENTYLDDEDMDLEDFDAEFISPGKGTFTVEVKVLTETPEAKEHFDRWFADFKARHEA